MIPGADWILLKGIAIGLLIAAPVGPVNVLCARRAITEGWRSAVVSGLGAALADTLFAAAAAFGLVVLVDVLRAHRVALAVLGGVFLLVYGWRTLRAAPPEPGAAPGTAGLLAGFATTFLLTLTNPITVFSFLGAYVAFGIPADAHLAAVDALLVGGVFLGASAWWLLVASAASLLRQRFTRAGFVWTNRIAGLTIIAFGLAILYAALAPR